MAYMPTHINVEVRPIIHEVEFSYTDPFVKQQDKVRKTLEILHVDAQRYEADEINRAWDHNEERDALLAKLLKAQDQARDYLLNFPADLEELILKLAAEKDGFE
jgi:hypothetical protein